MPETAGTASESFLLLPFVLDSFSTSSLAHSEKMCGIRRRERQRKRDEKKKAVRSVFENINTSPYSFCFLLSEIRSQVVDYVVKDLSPHYTPIIIRSDLNRCSHCADPVAVLVAHFARPPLIQDIINCYDVRVVVRR